MVDRQGRVGAVQPFDSSGVSRGAHGTLRYDELPTTLVTMLRASVDRVPDREAIVELGGPRLTYRQLWDGAAKVAGGLRDAGVEPGDRVAIVLANGVSWVLAFYGAQLAGAVAVPVNTRLAPPEVDYVLDDSGAGIVVRSADALPEGAPFVHDGAGPDDLAAIFYTSGTTGFPKGAETTHANFLSNSETCLRVVGLDRDAAIRNLVSVPLFHVTGCNSQLLVTTQVGGCTVIMPAFDVQAFLSAVVDERIDLLTSVPAIYWLAMNQPNFADFDMSGVTRVAYGGAPCPVEVIHRLRASFPNAELGNGFGLTETSSVATFLPDQFCESRPETVGLAAPVVELDLLDPDAEGVGELLIRGPNVVRGYWNKAGQTAETFVDGWLHSGDLARIDDDGFVQIVDRAKDMVNRGGENVYCVEVENALMQNRDVFDVAVVGVPDPMMGEKVGAVIVPRPGAAPSGADVRAAARELLADFKLPEYVVFRSEPLPRNPGGKLLKPRIREATEWGQPIRD